MGQAAIIERRGAHAVRCIDRELLLDVAAGDIDRTIALAAALECVLTPVLQAITGRREVDAASAATAAIRDLPRWATIGRTDGDQVLDPTVTVARALRKGLGDESLLGATRGATVDQQAIALLRGAGLSVTDIARLLRLPVVEVAATAEVVAPTSLPRDVARRLRALRPALTPSTGTSGGSRDDAHDIDAFELDIRVPAAEILPRALAREIGVDPKDPGWLGAMLQPIVDLATGRTVTEELLVRWITADGQLVPTERWIAVAEEADLLGDLAVWTIGTAIAEAATADLPVAVNVTPGQLMDHRLLTTIVDALTAAGQPASALRLELTETARVQDIPSARRAVCDLHDLGITLDLDDFGTGYSSITYLRDLPIDGFKLDRSYVGDLGLRSNATAIVRGLLDLGRALGLTVTAEGVERDEQLDELRVLGCDRGQGYLFATPRPLAPRNTAAERPIKLVAVDHAGS